MSKYVKTEQGYVKKIGEVGTVLESEIFNDYTNNIASGQHSHAEGSSTTASGDYSHAEGYYTTASGHTSHAEGRQTKASGSYSHAEGAYTTASGSYSHAEGYQTTAMGPYSHVEGRYNIEDTSSTYAHIVGNGSTSTRSNAHTLDWNGNAEYQGDVIANGCGGNNPISLINMSTQVEALKSDLGSLSLGTHTDNLAYIFRDGQPIGNGIEMTGGSGGNSEFVELFRVTTTEEVLKIETGIDLSQYEEIVALCSTLSSDGTTHTHFAWNVTGYDAITTKGLHGTQKRVHFLHGKKVTDTKWGFEAWFGVANGTIFESDSKPGATQANTVTTGVAIGNVIPLLIWVNGGLNPNFKFGAYTYGNTNLAIGTEAIVWGR